MATKQVTLFQPPPLDPSKAPIENVLELTPVLDIGPDVFTNTRPLWHPPGARGIYGGAAIAQSLSAAQRTVPANFTVHSMHCYFVLAGDSEIPILYHVERVRDGKSFATRTVQARQRGRPIFTTTLSFSREDSGGKKKLEHAVPMPDVPLPEEDDDAATESGGGGPFESRRAGILNHDSPNPEDKKVRQFIRARGRISDAGGHQAHLSALAYMSDSYFIGTVSRVHHIPRFPSAAALQSALKSLKNPSDLDDDTIKRYVKELAEQESEAAEMLLKSSSSDSSKNGGKDLKTKTEALAAAVSKRCNNDEHSDKQIGMMVSLDHTIYFHNPRAFRADEWLFTEMDSPWAGEGRGLVTQRIWNKDGVLIATCVQEGVVRLKQDDPVSSPPRSAKL